MAENLLSDARVRSASLARDGAFLPDGGGLRIRLLAPSRSNPKGAKLAEYHFKIKQADGTYKNGVFHCGTIGSDFVDDGALRPFTLADARARRDAARLQVSQGIDPRQAQRLERAEHVEAQRQRLAELDGRRTVAQAFERWHTLYLSKHRKDGGAMVKDLFDRRVLPTIGELPLDALRRAQIGDALDAIVADGRLRTANMALSLIRQFLGWCLAREWIAADPTRGLSKSAIGGKDKPRDRTLSKEEIVELRDKMPAAKLPKRIEHALWFILATGCRVGELSNAREADFDRKASLWTIPETKNGLAHVVHLSPFALAQLDALRSLRGKSAYLLPAQSPKDGGEAETAEDRPIGDKLITKMVGDRQRETPLKGRTKAAATLLLARGKWTPHDLRRTMASRMRGDLGISSDVVERCLNHKPEGIVGVYQTDELMTERKAAFEAWGAELQRLLRTKPKATATRSTGNVVTLRRAANTAA